MKSQTTSRLLRSGAAQFTGGAKITVGPPATKSDAQHVAESQHKIQVNRNDNGVESIEVVCKCGEKIVIRCDYE